MCARVGSDRARVVGRTVRDEHRVLAIRRDSEAQQDRAAEDLVDGTRYEVHATEELGADHVQDERADRDDRVLLDRADDARGEDHERERPEEHRCGSARQVNQRAAVVADQVPALRISEQGRVLREVGTEDPLGVPHGEVVVRRQEGEHQDDAAARPRVGAGQVRLVDVDEGGQGNAFLVEVQTDFEPMNYIIALKFRIVNVFYENTLTIV